MSNFHVAILGAMPQEVGETIKYIDNCKTFSYGDLNITQGEFFQQDSKDKILISIAWSGWGKVSASRAATRLISLNNQKLDLLLFTGVAGSVSKDLKQWDIVIPDNLIQHDMDARPIFNKFVIPALNQDKVKINKKLVSWAIKSLKKAISSNSKLSIFGKVNEGLIATGDKFIGNNKELIKLKKDIPDLVAVEMEGAAVAQVALQENIPCLIVRVISDNADDNAASNFDAFLKEYEIKSWYLIKALLNKINVL